jgi:putative transcriptional regulator
MAKMKLDKLLKDSRYNQKDVSDYTGINKNTISKYVNNTFEKIDKGHIDLLCDLFRCTPNDLLELEPVQQKMFPPSEIGNWMDISNTDAVGHEYNKKPLLNQYTLKMVNILKEEHKSGFLLGRKEIKENEIFEEQNGYNPIQSDKEILEMEEMQSKLDLEFNIESNLNSILNNIVLNCEPSIYEKYKNEIDKYYIYSMEEFNITFKLIPSYRLIYNILSSQSNSSELLGFLTRLRNIYAHGGLLDLSDNDLQVISNASVYFFNEISKNKSTTKQKD